MSHTNQSVSSEAWAASVKRQSTINALGQPGRSDEYYRYHKHELAKLGGTLSRRMERRTDAQALFDALATADRTERQIRSYPPAKRRYFQQRIIQLRSVAKRGLRRLGYEV